MDRVSRKQVVGQDLAPTAVEIHDCELELAGLDGLENNAGIGGEIEAETDPSILVCEMRAGRPVPSLR